LSGRRGGRTLPTGRTLPACGAATGRWTASAGRSTRGGST
jgi:hypothetical protein